MMMGLSDLLQDGSNKTDTVMLLTILLQSCQFCDNLLRTFLYQDTNNLVCVKLVTSSQQVVFAIIIPSYQEASEQLVVVTKVVRLLHVWKRIVRTLVHYITFCCFINSGSFSFIKLSRYFLVKHPPYDTKAQINKISPGNVVLCILKLSTASAHLTFSEARPPTNLLASEIVRAVLSASS